MILLLVNECHDEYVKAPDASLSRRLSLSKVPNVDVEVGLGYVLLCYVVL